MQFTYIPFAPASVPTPENLRFGKNGNHFVIEWDPVQDTNVCGYYLYRWNNDKSSRSEYRCSKDKTMIRLLNYTIEEEIAKIFPDGTDAVEFNVVSVANDSTGSKISNTLIVTRQDLLETMHTVNNPKEIISEKIDLIQFSQNGIKITLREKDCFFPQKINLFSLNGKLIKATVMDKNVSQEYFFSIKKDIVPSLMILHIKMSDGNKISQLITSPR
jgi:hypothetical protein